MKGKTDDDDKVRRTSCTRLESSELTTLGHGTEVGARSLPLTGFRVVLIPADNLVEAPRRIVFKGQLECFLIHHRILFSPDAD